MVPAGCFPAAAIVAGAVAGLAVPSAPPDAALGAAAIAWVIAAAAWWRGRTRIAAVLALGAAGLAALAWSAAAAGEALYTPLRAALHAHYGGFRIDAHRAPPAHDPIQLDGILAEDAEVREDGATLRIESRSVRLLSGAVAVSGGVLVTVGGAVPAATASTWTRGRAVSLPVTFRRPARYLNEGVPDLEWRAALGGITLQATAKSALLVEVRAAGPVHETGALVRRHVRRTVQRWVGARDALSASIVVAILIGDRTGLDPDLRDRLQRAGIYHVIAISGGNIAVLLVLVLGVCALSGATSRRAACVAIGVIVLYAGLVVGGPSVWRAATMAVVYLCARVLGHRSPPQNALAVSAALLVAANPLHLVDAGFALTFGATAALMATVRSFPPGGGALHWIRASIAASAAVEIVLLPVSAVAFSRVTAAGLLLNLLAVPLMGVVQLAGTIVVLASGAGSVAASAAAAADTAARLIVWSAGAADSAPWSVVRTPPPPAFVVVVYCASLAGVAAWSGRRRAVAGAVVGVAGVLVMTGIRVGMNDPSGLLRLVVFDVGQGEAMSLELPDGRVLMVDTGGVGIGARRFDIGGRVLAPALWARGVRRLHAMLITHGDPDHVGGAEAVLRDFGPSHLWSGVPVPRHDALRRLEEAGGHQGIATRGLHTGATLTFGAVQVRVLHPPVPDWERQRVRNDDSVVLEIQYGQVAFLLTGDVSAAVERLVLPQLTPARIRILKVGHHGSRTSTSAELVGRWKPQVAIISCGRGNRFGHPAAEVLARLRRSGVRVYRTDEDGQVVIETDGRSVQTRTFRDGSARAEGRSPTALP